jgi:hypothetical protein
MFHPQNGYFSLVFSQAAQKPRPRPTTSSALNTKVKAPGMGYFLGEMGEMGIIHHHRSSLVESS